MLGFLMAGGIIVWEGCLCDSDFLYYPFWWKKISGKLEGG